VCKLNKSLYGLKQSLRDWYSRMDTHIQKQIFKKGAPYNNLYIKKEYKNMTIIIVSVDNIIFVCDDDNIRNTFFEETQNEFRCQC
jgi:hypothetical protein